MANLPTGRRHRDPSLVVLPLLPPGREPWWQMDRGSRRPTQLPRLSARGLDRCDEQWSGAVPSQGFCTAYCSEQAVNVGFELLQKIGRTADVLRTSHFFNLAGPLGYLWYAQIAELSLPGVGSGLDCFRLPVFHGKPQGCQVFRSLGEKD